MSSVYVGGGTPSILSSAQLHSLFLTIRSGMTIADDAEVTVEVNPATAAAETFQILRQEGVTRLSIGVQSFSDDILRTLGRAHDVSASHRCMADAHSAGFDNINFDLIYAVPGQSTVLWMETIETAVSLEPQHLSLYSLSLDEGTPFKREAEQGRIVLPGDERAEEMYIDASRFLSVAGYRRYELSNFAKDGFHCRHNKRYWQREEYIGFGAGAWSFIGGERTANVADVPDYISRAMRGVTTTAFFERPSDQQATSEYIMLGLRLSSGVNLSHFAATFGKGSYDALMCAVEKNSSAGLFAVIGEYLCLTERGALLANDAAAMLMA